MIIKPTTKPAELEFLEEVIADEEFAALPTATQDRLKRHRRGLWGERDTAHMLDRHFHAAKNTAVIHDLRLPDGLGGFAQFDHLLLNRIGELATIIEVKNYAGTLSKNDHDEWIVWYKGQRVPKDIPNPVAQAQRQREILRSWFRQHGLGRVFPFVNVFVSVPPECKIDRSKIEQSVPIVKSDNLYAKWEGSFEVSGFDVLLSGRISVLDLQQVAKRIAREHVPGPDIYDELGLRPAEDHTPTSSDHSGDAVAEVELDIPPDITIVEAETPVIEALDLAGANGGGGARSQVESAQAGGAAERPNAVQTLGGGIMERVLRDGRIGFSADARVDGAKERLAETCRGRARWISRYQNWVCDDDRALEIKTLLNPTLVDVVLPHVPEQSVKPETQDKLLPGTAGQQSTDCPTKKAGAPSLVCTGVTERVLPDGRVAFRASPNDQGARDALAVACKGKAQWNPRFQNWIVNTDRAVEIRAEVQRMVPGTPAVEAPREAQK